MGMQIELKKTFEIQDCLCLAVTNSCVAQMNEIEDYETIIQKISSLEMITITRSINQNKGNREYILHTRYGQCACVKSDESSHYYLIRSFKKNTFASQNIAIKHGVCFKFLDGICISVKYKSLNAFFECKAGVYTNENYVDNNYGTACESIDKAFDSLDSSNNTHKLTSKLEIYKPSKELKEVLDIAKGYSEIISEIEENKVYESGQLVYSNIVALDFERTDRIAYRFVVEKLHKEAFPIGAQVELTNMLGNTFNAEILNSEMDDAGERHVDLLFNKQINIESFEKTGLISLSFSTVNRDVQLQAIEKIYNGTANAKYMDDVLGTFTPKGFDNLDLSYLTDHYNDKTFYTCPPFPPNPSQQEAIINGIKSKDAFLVMGPPGTGKTTVILEWIKYFVLEKHLRVLVSSQNNKAVDNVLERIIEEKDIDVLRIGSETKLQENVKQCMFENKITALRENIVNTSVENKKKLNDFVDEYVLLSKNLTSLESINNEVIATKKSLDVQTINLKKSCYVCKKAYDKTKRKQNAINSCIIKAQKLSDSNKKYSITEKNKLKVLFAVFKFFINVIIVLNKKLLGYNIKRFYTLKSKYINKFHSYKILYDNIRENEFNSFFKARYNQNKLFENVADTINKQDEFGINTLKLEKELLAENNYVSKIKEIILEYSQKAKDTIKIITSWSNEMNSNQNYALNEIIMQSVNLVGATCIGINSQKRFSDLQFDVTIIDEAGQIQIHNALVPMSVSDKLIMLGDHKQIPPTADQEIMDILADRELSTELYEKSLFEVMYENLPETNKRMLDTQFRMPGEIADIISEWFYDGKYLSADFKRGVKSLIPQISVKPLAVIDTSDNPNRFETEVQKGDMKERHNELECNIIVDICNHLREQEFDFSELGIISALKAQVVRIKEKLIEAGFDKTSVNESVATLDSFQGQERKIILYSFTRSADKSVNATRVGFLTELRRLNVAMSRCKQNIVLIGDMTYLSECEKTTGNKGEEISIEKTEKNFSDFIIKMLSDIKNKDRGEIISSKEFKSRLESSN